MRVADPSLPDLADARQRLAGLKKQAQSFVLLE
jgi:hypothetical protein